MEKKILVVNCGSSTVKLGLFRLGQGDELQVVCRLLFDKIGQEEGYIRLSTPEDTVLAKKESCKTIREALHEAKKILMENSFLYPEELLAVGHRVVHGGGFIHKPVFVDEEVKRIIRECFPFAPLHNPWNLEGIEVSEKLFETSQVAVFDTAFHTTLPTYAKTYAIPYDLAQKYQIYRYGFHGTSHEYVAQKASQKMGKDFLKWTGITLHLGSGASICAIKNGQSVDISMGFTPLEGLVMGTRCGDIDPSLVVFLQEKEGLIAKDILQILNKKSGLLGLAGHADMRSILDLFQKGDERAKLALDVFAYRIRKYIGAYFFVLGQVDALVFTGGIGENAYLVRQKILEGLENFGIFLNQKANKNPEGYGGLISESGQGISIWVIPTDEEKVIALKVWALKKVQPK